MVNLNSAGIKMSRIGNFLRSLNDLQYFLGVLIAAISFVSTVVGLISTFGVDLLQFKELKWLLIYLILIHCILAAFIALYIRQLVKFADTTNIEEEIINETDSLLADDLISSLKSALDSKNYLEVIRIGTALSKPFFVSGNYKAKLSIGLLVEEAAASINDEHTQMVELIDSIGWMYVEVGDLEKGEKNIRHGMQYAIRNANHFYISKSYRHLGAISRRKEDYENAKNFYKLSLESAEQIQDSNKKAEAIAGANYAQALLHYHTKQFQTALEYIDLSITKFESINHYEKIIMAKTTKAQIFFALDKISESKDLFRTSLVEAEKRSLRLEITRCLIGLTKICIKTGDFKKAKEYLDKSDKVEKHIQTASEISEINILRTQIP